MAISIVNDRIEGTRITIWDITHYLEGGEWTIPQIAAVLRLSVEQVEAAVEYIEANKEEVWAVHRQIEERNRGGNPPEIEAKRVQSAARMQAWLAARRVQSERTNGARDIVGP